MILHDVYLSLNKNEYTAQCQQKVIIMKTKKLLMMAAGTVITALVTFGSLAKAVDILQSQEIKIRSTTSLPHLVAATIQSTDVSHVKSTVSEQKSKQLRNQILISCCAFKFPRQPKLATGFSI